MFYFVDELLILLCTGPFESKSEFTRFNVGAINLTPMFVVMAHTLQTAGDLIKASVPLQRIGTPEDVAGTALFLASRAGAYVNGATIAVDGGYLVSMRLRGEGKL
jgi:NAD(P)-dependent dehydrogenase (short-subunit alcohol dehydrogenase family)